MSDAHSCHLGSAECPVGSAQCHFTDAHSLDRIIHENKSGSLVRCYGREIGPSMFGLYWFLLRFFQRATLGGFTILFAVFLVVTDSTNFAWNSALRGLFVLAWFAHAGLILTAKWCSREAAGEEVEPVKSGKGADGEGLPLLEKTKSLEPQKSGREVEERVEIFSTSSFWLQLSVLSFGFLSTIALFVLLNFVKDKMSVGHWLWLLDNFVLVAVVCFTPASIFGDGFSLKNGDGFSLKNERIR